MEPLFEVTTKYTYHEMKRYDSYVLSNIVHYYQRIAALVVTLAVIGVALILFASGPIGVMLLVGSLAGGVLGVTINAARRSKQLMKNPLLDELVTVRFYEEHFTVDCNKNHTEHDYSLITCIGETDSDFYIVLSSGVGVIAAKPDCSPELMEHIRSLIPAKWKKKKVVRRIITVLVCILFLALIVVIFRDQIYSSFNGVVYKPVIYLYPQQETQVSVYIDTDLTVTYPEYNGGWNVTAQPDGTLYTADGREYSYLFWEGNSDTEWDFSEGFCVKGGDTAEFLQYALSEQGLTPKEYNEFIVYWMPLMQDNEYNIISFQGEIYDRSAPLSITPQPDTVKRVFMAYYSSEKPVEISPQELCGFERNGFTVVEWGGTEVSR